MKVMFPVKGPKYEVALSIAWVPPSPPPPVELLDVLFAALELLLLPPVDELLLLAPPVELLDLLPALELLLPSLEGGELLELGVGASELDDGGSIVAQCLSSAGFTPSAHFIMRPSSPMISFMAFIIFPHSVEFFSRFMGSPSPQADKKAKKAVNAKRTR